MTKMTKKNWNSMFYRTQRLHNELQQLEREINILEVPLSSEIPFKEITFFLNDISNELTNIKLSNQIIK